MTDRYADIRAAIPALALGFAAVFGAIAEARPPEDLTVSQWADAHRQIAAESGSPFPGQWKTSRNPPAGEMQDVCGVDHPAREVAIAGSAQSTKSEVLLNAAFHCVDTAPRSMLILAPSIDKAIAYNREKWEPNVQVTEPIALKTYAQKGRSNDASTSLHKRFVGGFCKIVSAATAKQLQSSTIGFVILEEPTDYPLDADGRGDPIAQVRHRMDAYGEDGKLIAASTTGEKGACRITAMVEKGDHRRLYLPCPHCGDYHVLRIEAMGMHGRRDPVLGFMCPSCGGIIEEHHRAAMLDAFAWCPTFEAEDAEANPAPPAFFPASELARWASAESHLRIFGAAGGRPTDGRYPSFHFWQGCSPFSSWARIWREWRAARDNPELLKTFYQQVLAEPYEPAHDRPKWELIRDTMKGPAIVKLARIQRGKVPSWASLLIGSADVQGDRIEWGAFAFGPRALMARIDRGVIDIDPDDNRAWTELARVSRFVYEGPTIKPITFDRFACDTGGHHTSQAYLGCFRHGITAIKGKPNDPEAAAFERGKMAKVRDDSGRIIARVPLWLVGTHRLKKRLYYGLNQTILSADSGRLETGAVMLEPDLSEADARQIVAEYLVEEIVKGKKRQYWDRPKWQANEQLDLAVYALAQAIGWGLDRLNAAGWERWAAGRAKDPALDGVGPLEALMLGPDEAADPASAIEDAIEDAAGDGPQPVNDPSNRTRAFRKDALRSLSNLNKRDDA